MIGAAKGDPTLNPGQIVIATIDAGIIGVDKLPQSHSHPTSIDTLDYRSHSNLTQYTRAISKMPITILTLIVCQF